MELGEVLRDRRKAAGRTIASVAVDAGLSVPYIANLENGRGNPTVAALDRLATALGAQLEVRIGDEVPPPPLSVGSELVSGSGRVDEVVAALAGDRSRAATRRELIATLDSLATLLGRPPSAADLSRLLDLLQLASPGRAL
ncbi:helix-turn-helix domain-containing protein [Kribbella sp. NBC_00709]|uniref:helix-turn-helix domain-containing protein n=1 Tax=Kribbella sp. NBC_00709 TaxID=2975972 RepID=UPI002E2CD815|nr:helix-turn-helix transcriptional regulator [Kribbella sp. NBC_00709]